MQETFLETLLRRLNNWFLAPKGIHNGEFGIKDGGVSLPFLLDGQYFRVFGSTFNDGLHQYPASDLVDEDFTGTVWALAIPQKVFRVAEKYKSDYENEKSAVYSSESFGGYSYTRMTNGSGKPVSVVDLALSELSEYQKIGGARP